MRKDTNNALPTTTLCSSVFLLRYEKKNTTILQLEDKCHAKTLDTMGCVT